jgi:hypothetical protein
MHGQEMNLASAEREPRRCRSPARGISETWGYLSSAGLQGILSNHHSDTNITITNKTNISVFLDGLFSQVSNPPFVVTHSILAISSLRRHIAMAFAGIDIDKLGQYPIVLSDALLGKTTKEVYTGIRCMHTYLQAVHHSTNIASDNHKPEASSDSSSMHLDHSNVDANTFDLSYKNNSEKYSYQGVRVSGDGKYVMIFDPAQQHFVLHSVDSTFDMNLVSAPWDQDESSLRNEYPQIGTPQKSNTSAVQLPKRKPSTKAKAVITKTELAKQRKKPVKAMKPKPPPRAPTPEEEDEESDDGLDIEDPDGGVQIVYQYNPTPTFQRQDSEDASEEDSDADGEEWTDERNQDIDSLKLPSPVNDAGGMDDEDDDGLDLEAALEAELGAAFEDEAEKNDSSESEEE